jgi:hypothetical protein
MWICKLGNHLLYPYRLLLKNWEGIKFIYLFTCHNCKLEDVSSCTLRSKKKKKEQVMKNPIRCTETVEEVRTNKRVYPKVSGLAPWSENCKWYSSLPLGAVVSLFCEFCRHNPLCCFSMSVYCCLFRYWLSPETSGYTLVYCNIHDYEMWYTGNEKVRSSA